VDNAKTRHEGIEIELNWQISPVWYAELAATLQKHRYDSPTALLGSSGDINGNRIDTAPDSFGSARLGADTVMGIHPVKAELEYVWVGSYYVDPDNEHRYAGHRLVNLRADMQVQPKLKVSVIATNLLDTDYAERADFGFGQYRYFVGEPRSVVLGLSWQLD
jgi:outer membrane receptor protein involved in Fe transport